MQMVWQAINSDADRYDPIYGASNVIKSLYETYGGKQVAVRVEKAMTWGKAISSEPGADHLKWISELTNAQDELGRLKPPPTYAELTAILVLIKSSNQGGQIGQLATNTLEQMTNDGKIPTVHQFRGRLATLNRINGPQDQITVNTANTTQNAFSGPPGKCRSCGTKCGSVNARTRREKCPARDNECKYCWIKGHYDTLCYSKKNKKEGKSLEANIAAAIAEQMAPYMSRLTGAANEQDPAPAATNAALQAENAELRAMIESGNKNHQT